MNIATYQLQFDELLQSENPPAPYNDAAYYEYTKLNAARFNRWMKTAVISPEHTSFLNSITQTQKWIVITEHWCGDAAHIVPIIAKMAALNPNITLDIQLRDTEPFLIDAYLTNGGKSIPILIIRDASDKDILVWGPRPKGAQDLFNDLKNNNASFESIKIALQNWYNDDKAVAIQNEIVAGLQAAMQ